VDDGRVVAIDAKGSARDIATFEGQLITAMTVIGRDLYVATGPDATIHRIKKGGKPTKVATLKTTFVWDMVDAGKGAAFVATGEPATVSRVELGSGKSKVLFEPEQAHLRSLCYEPKLGLFAGGGERGILYRSKDLENFRALFDSGHTEITSIVARGGYAYVSGVTGADALVKAQGAGETKGVEVRSQMVRVSMDGAAETLAGSNDEAIFDMAFDSEGRVLVATGATGREDPRGRLYSIEPTNRDIALLYQSPSRRIQRLVEVGSDLAAVAAAGGRVVMLGTGMAKKGEFFTAPFDAGINAKIGAVRLYGSWPSGTKARAAVRSGQTATPDATWSEWSKDVTGPGGQSVAIPNGRYFQTRLTLTGNGKTSPTVHRIRVAYLRQNLPPFVREVVTLEKGVALLPITRQPQSSTTVNLNGGNTPPKKPDAPKPNNNARARKVKQRGALTVRWVAEDPNGDELEYDLRYRSLGNQGWTELEKSLDEPFYTLNSAQLPDGHYQFQVRATDAPSNPDGVYKDD
ncbi:MAG: fibronectin type III domain-containing protein, partial [Myxococcota bacterium]